MRCGPGAHLALAALGVHPVLVLHLARDAHQVGLHHLVLDGRQALLLMSVFLLLATTTLRVAGPRDLHAAVRPRSQPGTRLLTLPCLPSCYLVGQNMQVHAVASSSSPRTALPACHGGCMTQHALGGLGRHRGAQEGALRGHGGRHCSGCSGLAARRLSCFCCLP